MSLPFFKAFLFIFFLIFSGEVTARSFKTPTSPSFQNFEPKVDIQGRKMIEVNSLLLDYDPPGANPAHEPPRRGNSRGSP